MYAIMIKEKTNSYRFLSVKKEIMKETVTQVTDPDTNEVKDEVTLTGTGDFETVRFETESRDELEANVLNFWGLIIRMNFFQSILSRLRWI